MAVAQLVVQWIVIPPVAGSSPVSHLFLLSWPNGQGSRLLSGRLCVRSAPGALWCLWRSWSARQIVDLEVMGSNPIWYPLCPHSSKRQSVALRRQRIEPRAHRVRKLLAHRARRLCVRVALWTVCIKKYTFPWPNGIRHSATNAEITGSSPVGNAFRPIH